MKKSIILGFALFLSAASVAAPGCSDDGGKTAGDGDAAESEETAEIEEASEPEWEPPETIFDPDWKPKTTYTDVSFLQRDAKFFPVVNGKNVNEITAVATNGTAVFFAANDSLYRADVINDLAVEELTDYRGIKIKKIAFIDKTIGSDRLLGVIVSDDKYIYMNGVSNFTPKKFDPGVNSKIVNLFDYNQQLRDNILIFYEDGTVARANVKDPDKIEFALNPFAGVPGDVIDACAPQKTAGQSSPIYFLSKSKGVYLDGDLILPADENAAATGLVCSHSSADDSYAVVMSAKNGLKTYGNLSSNFGVTSEELKQNLPYNDLTGIKLFYGLNAGELPAEATSLAVSSDKGLMIFNFADKPQWEYYNSKYYLPDIRIAGFVHIASKGLIAAVATPQGFGIIEKKALSLTDKAKILDDGMYERHNRMGMFSGAHLTTPGDLSTHVSYDDDNDGQWTGMYLASQSFRYAATKDPEAYARAKEAATALLKLLGITGKKGFFARSVIEGDKCPSKQCSGCGEWHLTEDGQWCWKGDTSTDEYVGHIFGLSIFYDYAATEADKALVRRAFVDLHDGLIANGYAIQDVDGETTSDGHMEPEFINTFGLFGDAGLNSAMILGGLRATYHMSGEQRFLDAFNYLAYEEGYAEHVSKIEEINLKTHINHDSEEMSFLAMTTLMRYETVPELMELWRKGMQYLWEVQIPEKNAEANMIYAYVMQDNMNPADGRLDDSIQTLKEWHLHGINWPVTNSHRLDYTPNGKDRADHPQSKEVFPYYQKQAMRWSENPYRLDWGGEGNYEQLLTPYLLPYWMGRAAGIIK